MDTAHMRKGRKAADNGGARQHQAVGRRLDGVGTNRPHQAVAVARSERLHSVRGWLKTGANASKVINIEVGDPGKRIHERGEVHRGRTSEKWSTARSPSPRRRTSHGIASTADALSKPSGTLGRTESAPTEIGRGDSTTNAA